MKIGILEGADFSAGAKKALKALGTVKIYQEGKHEDFVKDVDVLFVRLGLRIDGKLLSSAKKLKVICSPTTGLNHIDLAFCKRNGIRVLSLKGETRFLETIRATPEHTLGLILALRRNYANAFLGKGNTDWNREKYKGFEVFQSKVGIIGYGRVGKILSRYLMSMGANVAYYDPNQNKGLKNVVKYSSNKDLITDSDTIVLCASYEGHVIIGKKELDLMGGRYFINTARAELTDEVHLLKLLSKGHFKGIATDVIQDEQTKNNRLKEWISASETQNAIITPHIGGATYTSMERTEVFMVEKLKREIDGK